MTEVVGRRRWFVAGAALIVAGWGANQYTPLSVAYRIHEGWQTLTVVSMFTIYLLGLVPALLFGVRVSDRWGRRTVIGGALLGLGGASTLLSAAQDWEGFVYTGRALAGAAVGLVIAAAGEWLRELSGDVTIGRRDRRSIYATGIGFAGGPLLTGALVEWGPRPLVAPALVQAGASVVVAAFVWRADETVATTSHTRVRGRERWQGVFHPRFVGLVLPTSPAIFGAVTVSYVVLPPLVLAQVRGFAPLFSGVVACTTLGVGLAAQPVGRWIDRPGSVRSTVIATVTVIVGLLVGALAVSKESPAMVIVAAVILGAGYGLTIEAGLAELNRSVAPAALPAASALFQGVAHSGFLAPLLLAVNANSGSYPQLIAGLALLGVGVLAVAALYARRHSPMEGTNQWAE